MNRLHCIVLIGLILALPEVVRGQELTGKVVDENGKVVAGVKVSLGTNGSAPAVAVSNEAGRFYFDTIAPGSYELKAEKPGYYATISRTLEIKGNSAPLEVVLNHQQEFEETVNVAYSAPVVDRQEASKAATLTAEEITDLPTVATHDFHNSLPLIPGIVKDNAGRMHLNGGGENQVFYSLDGFNITSPVSGAVENRISVDAIRTLRVDTSRYSAEYGKGSAGVMALESTQGDDQFRFSATNFVPAVVLDHRLRLTNWNPRATISGPIAKNRAWYFNALDLQYDSNLVKELPPGANTDHSWQGGDLTRVQVNLNNGNILTGGFMFNFREAGQFGLSPLVPIESTRDLSERIYFFNLRDQAYFEGGWVLEAGFAVNRMNNRQSPLGRSLYVISPQGQTGSYYLLSQGNVDRTQAVASLLTPLWSWHGRHSFKAGVDADRIRYRRFSDRSPIQIQSSDGSISRQVSFAGNPVVRRDNFEFSGFFQDSWTIDERLFVEAGMRFDWDEVLRRRLWSPRLAFTWGPARLPDAKFSAGIGVFHDATNLSLLAQTLDQQRRDTFYDSDGAVVAPGPLTTQFAAEERNLKAPVYINWSLGWQQKLGGGFYFEASFIRKKGRRIWAYDLSPAVATPLSQYAYRLGSDRKDRYYFVEAELSRTFGGKYPWLLSYARSSARTSEVIDFAQDNPIFSGQQAGPLNWDTPNRLISWSVLPVPHFKKFSLAYFAEWHTGMPWSVVNRFQQLVGDANARRYPDYFSLNLHVERRFRFFRSEWAMRVGFNNITGHENPTVVVNNIDAADFGRFSSSQSRVFTGRIRFLGKN